MTGVQVIVPAKGPPTRHRYILCACGRAHMVALERPGLSRKEVGALLKREIERAGSMRGLANEWGVSRQYIWDALHETQSVGPGILKHLGLRRVVRVERFEHFVPEGSP